MKRLMIMTEDGGEELSDDPQWYKDAIFYEVRVRSFYDKNGDGIGDLQGLTEKLDYLKDLGITTVWLLPFYPSPLRDDGYDISSYTDVHPEVGTLDDFKIFLAEAHRRGLRVITELVLNHTSDQHPWFQRARRSPPGSPERDFYVWSDTAERYKAARIIFNDFEPSNWAWDPIAKAYFWHRFYAHQPDLNFESPLVKEELLRVVDFWLELGVDGLRLDAVPYLYEEDGTSCENLPATHAFLRTLRARVDARFKNRMLLAEANQWPEDAAAYFGAGDECHMNFHFPIMPRLFMAIHMEDRFPIIDILAQTPQLPPACQWALFLRNHDELTLEMVTDEERDYMYKAYAAEPTMRINLGIRRRLAPLAQNDRRKMELWNALLLSLPGTPVIYYGDEIGMGDNVYLGDRNGVRTPMQWSADRNAGFSRANPQRLILPIIIDPEYHYESIHVEAQQNNPSSLLWWMKRLIALRKRRQAFGRGSMEILSPENQRVLAFVRHYEGELILVVANLSRTVQFVELDLSKYKGNAPVELSGGAELPVIGDAPYPLTLGGHAFYWFSLEAPRAAGADARAASFRPPVLDVVVQSDGEESGPPSWRGGLSILQGALPTYLESRPWFPRSGRSITGAEVLDSVRLGEAPIHSRLVLTRIDYSEGDPDTIVLPLAAAPEERAAEIRARSPQATIAYIDARESGQENKQASRHSLLDASTEAGSSRSLLAALLSRRTIEGSAGQLVSRTFCPLDLSEADVLALEPRVVRGDNPTAALIYGDRLLVKLFRRMEEGTSPDLEIGRFLAERRHFTGTPPLCASLEYKRRRGEASTVALLYEYPANATSGWTVAREELARYYEKALARGRDEAAPEAPSGGALELASAEPPAQVTEIIGSFLRSAESLGRRTAELHLALASEPADPAFAPEVFSSLYQRSKYQSMRNLTGKVMRLLKSRLLAKLPEAASKLARSASEREAELLSRFERVLRAKVDSVRIRCHGDYHLGQTLFTGRDFLIVNFEGDRDRTLPDRRRRRTSLRDVAGMLLSFHNAAYTALLDEPVVRPSDRAAAAPWARAWVTWVSAAFLRGYLGADLHVGRAQLVPSDRDALEVLLDVSLLEKALYEIGSELSAGSARVVVPLHGLLQMLDVRSRGAP